MLYLVYVRSPRFTGYGEAIESNERYPLGERHAITIFSRQPEVEEPDYQLAAERTFSSGWDDFEFDTTRTLAIAPEKMNLV